MIMDLKTIISGVNVLNTIGNLDLNITNIHSDSRKIKQDGLFVAINGFSQNGTKFIPNAIENGAIAILVEPDVNIANINFPNVAIISVNNTRQALAISACNFYDNPSKKLNLIGVTGTKGKTTTTFMLKSILEAHKLSVGLIGSIAVYINDEKIEDTDRTTPESIDIQKYLALMVERKVQVAIIEVSSQAMKLDRVTGSEFEIGVFTNFSEDHISPNEHPTMEDYFNSKLELLKMSKFGVINNDDNEVSKIKSLLPNKIIKTFGIENEADVKADHENTIISDSYVKFPVSMPGGTGLPVGTVLVADVSPLADITVPIPGKFSVYNALGAITASLFFDVTSDEIKAGLKDLRVLGRSELVPNKLGLTILIDYAHTPSSLESILTAVKTYAKGKVICAWGVGGNRDSAKRPVMGEISGRLADFTILMTDQARYEDPLKILKDIEIRNYSYWKTI